MVQMGHWIDPGMTVASGVRSCSLAKTMAWIVRTNRELDSIVKDHLKRCLVLTRAMTV